MVEDERLFIHFLYDRLLAWLYAPGPMPRGDLPSGWRFFPQAALAVHRSAAGHFVFSASRGGSWAWSSARGQRTEAALVLQDDRGQVAHSATWLPDPDAVVHLGAQGLDAQLSTQLRLYRRRYAGVVSQAAFRMGMAALGRFCRTGVRRWLQRLVISPGGAVPVWLRRRVRYRLEPSPGVEVTDQVELSGHRFVPRHIWIATDLVPQYTAAAGTAQPVLMQPWQDWSGWAPALRATGKLCLRRCYTLAGEQES